MIERQVHNLTDFPILTSQTFSHHPRALIFEKSFLLRTPPIPNILPFIPQSSLKHTYIQEQPSFDTASNYGKSCTANALSSTHPRSNHYAQQWYRRAASHSAMWLHSTGSHAHRPVSFRWGCHHRRCQSPRCHRYPFAGTPIAMSVALAVANYSKIVQSLECIWLPAQCLCWCATAVIRPAIKTIRSNTVNRISVGCVAVVLGMHDRWLSLCSIQRWFRVNIVTGAGTERPATPIDTVRWSIGWPTCIWEREARRRTTIGYWWHIRGRLAFCAARWAAVGWLPAALMDAGPFEVGFPIGVWVVIVWARTAVELFRQSIVAQG